MGIGFCRHAGEIITAFVFWVSGMAFYPMPAYVMALSQLIGLTMPGGIVTILQILLGLAAMVLCFIQPAAGFFTARKNFRMANKVR